MEKNRHTGHWAVAKEAVTDLLGKMTQEACYGVDFFKITNQLLVY